MDIYEKFKDVSFDNGKFLSDKSYAYDTVYFLAKFFNEYQENGYFDRIKWKTALYNYTIDKFHLYNGGQVVDNYYTESRWVLRYSKTIQEKKKDKLEIIDQEMLDFITKRMENAYIYLYLLCYYTLKNSKCLELYKEFCNLEGNNKSLKLREIYEIFTKSNKSGGDQWPKQCTEYILNVLNFLNLQPKVTRQLTFDYRLVGKTEMISVNTPGTKTLYEKDNKYLDNFDLSYVKEMLKDYIIYKGDEINE